MLRLFPAHRAAVVRILTQPFDSGEQIVGFVSGLAVSDHVRSAVRNSVRGIQPVTERDIAVDALATAALAADELPIVLFAIAEKLPGRRDIKQLILTLSLRPGWLSPDKIAIEQAQEVDLRSLMHREEGLESLTNDYDPFVDANAVSRCLSEALARVCFLRRHADGQHLGTGFLVARDRLLTCYHVVKGSIRDKTPMTLRADGLEAVFDYFCPALGVEPGPSALTVVPIDPMDESYYSPETDLDFAHLKLVSSPGDDRGFFELFFRDPEPHSPVIIAQHPGDPPPPDQPRRLLPLQVSWAQPGIHQVDLTESRVNYFNGTLKGASGSPVFDRSCTVVAMHQGTGDYANSTSVRLKCNRGVLIRAIAARLRASRSPPGQSARANEPESFVSEVAMPDLEARLSALEHAALTAIAFLKLGEDPDDIAAWAREPFSGAVLHRWASEHGRLSELQTALNTQKE